jgi:uracil-DNA glycosylase
MNKLQELLPTDWRNALQDHIHQPTFQRLAEFLQEEWKNETIYPPQNQIFQALHLTPLNQTRVVILGQDPYHGPNQAHGLAFSVLEEGLTIPRAKFPPSLRNILKELKNDLGIETSKQVSDLTPWAKQGILMINAVLTVRAGQPDSHKKKGWEEFTDQIIQLISSQDQPVVFVLWGNKAKRKQHLIAPHHHIILSAHPSPLSASRGFFGSHPFSKINHYLKMDGYPPIKWSLKSKNDLF